MLKRHESDNKEKVQYLLDAGLIKEIRRRANESDKTQSKYIADLVQRDGEVGSLDIQGLRAVLLDLCSYSADASSAVDSAVPRILEIFGMRQV